jgi:hypothetical protein
VWDALAGETAGSRVRLVFPVPEPDRAAFAQATGLVLAESWWHLAVAAGNTALDVDQVPRVAGAAAALVPAPRIYDPGGPVLFLSQVRDADGALPIARTEARRLACPVVLVSQPPTDARLRAALATVGYHYHCDFFEGTLTPTGSCDHSPTACGRPSSAITRPANGSAYRAGW